MRNLILTGGIFHPFKESSRALQKILMKEGIESEITEDIESGLKNVDEGEYNLLTVYALRWSMKNGSKYEPYSDQWEDWISILGGKWIWGKSGHLPFGIVNTRTETIKHPITNNITPFNLEDEVFEDLKTTKDITPLLSAKVEGQDKWHPVLWARNFSNGRIVYDALGHNAKSLNHPEHAKIIRRSANWAIGNLN